MFGLMRARRGAPQIAPRFRRLHYCGTCKTMGRLYGQKSRFLLNHDTVFLAELLSLLSGEDQRLAEWAGAYQSFNCLSLPDETRGDELPLPLQYAATATIVLTDYKLRDHVQDSATPVRRRVWHSVARTFSPAFRDATARLRQWDFPLGALESALAEQEWREQNPTDLAGLAEPTAQATALFFAHGATLVGRPELQTVLGRLGHLLGTVAYTADAWRDRQQDEERGEFNALHALGLDDLAARQLVEQSIGAAVAEMSSILATLPLPPLAVQQFTFRLRANLAPELPASLPLLKSKPARCATHPRKTLADRWREARQLAAGRRREWSTERGERWAGPVFATVTLLALLSPQQVRETHSVHECLGLSTNLMFWGSLAVPLALCGRRETVYVDQYGRPVQVVRQRGGGGGCGRDCCCCCEICACEACICEGCCCEECCSNCCSC